MNCLSSIIDQVVDVLDAGLVGICSDLEEQQQ